MYNIKSATKIVKKIQIYKYLGKKINSTSLFHKKRAPKQTLLGVRCTVYGVGCTVYGVRCTEPYAQYYVPLNSNCAWARRWQRAMSAASIA